MEYMKNQAANMIGGDYARDVAPSSELSSIAERIHAASSVIDSLIGQLCAHADRVHGEAPQGISGSTQGSAPCRMGQLGAVQDALDRLDSTIGRLNEQAGRNCTLA